VFLFVKLASRWLESVCFYVSEAFPVSGSVVKTRVSCCCLHDLLRLFVEFQVKWLEIV
jgi:hypothetical protein